MLKVDFNQFIIFATIQDTHLFEIQLRQKQLENAGKMNNKDINPKESLKQKLLASAGFNFEESSEDKAVLAQFLSDHAPVGYKGIISNGALKYRDYSNPRNLKSVISTC